MSKTLIESKKKSPFSGIYACIKKATHIICIIIADAEAKTQHLSVRIQELIFLVHSSMVFLTTVVMFIAHHTEENIGRKNMKHLMVFCITEQVYERRQMHIVYLEIRPSFLCPLCYSCCELKAFFYP